MIDIRFIIHNQQVMMDSDLAKLYQAEIKRSNETVKKALARFTEFRFQILKKNKVFKATIYDLN